MRTSFIEIFFPWSFQAWYTLWWIFWWWDQSLHFHFPQSFSWYIVEVLNVMPLFFLTSTSWWLFILISWVISDLMSSSSGNLVKGIKPNSQPVRNKKIEKTHAKEKQSHAQDSIYMIQQFAYVHGVARISLLSRKNTEYNMWLQYFLSIYNTATTPH